MWQMCGKGGKMRVANECSRDVVGARERDTEGDASMHSDFTTPLIYIAGRLRPSVERFLQRSGVRYHARADFVPGFYQFGNDLWTQVGHDLTQLRGADVVYAELEGGTDDLATVAAIAYASSCGIESQVSATEEQLPSYVSHLPWVYARRNVVSAVEKGWARHLTPIEEPMYWELQALQAWDDRDGCSRLRPVNILFLQWPIGPWRADFFMTPNVIIECDGVTYHSDPEKVIRDKQRDRWFAERGFKVLRFSTPEIQNNTDRCIGQVARILERGRKERGIVLD